MSSLFSRPVIGAALFFVLGCAVAVMAAQLPMGSLRLPGSGAFPLAIGISLMLLGGGLIAQSLRGETAVLDGDHEAEPGGQVRVLFVCALLALYIFALPFIGFALDTAWLMIALYAIGAARLGFAQIAAGLLTAGGAYALFVVLLDVRLPQGTLWGY